MRAPTHLCGTTRLRLLCRWANALRTVYGVPVYLAGSALRDDNPDPRDWDIRLCLPDRQFAIRYGGDGAPLDAPAVILQWNIEGATGQWTRLRQRWSDDCVRHAKEGARWTWLNIDFQVYPQSHCRSHYRDQPRYRLDRFSPT